MSQSSISSYIFAVSFLSNLMILSGGNIESPETWKIKLLSKFEPPQESSRTSYGLTEVITKQKAYFEEKQNQPEYPTVLNLNIYLSQISSLKNCFVVVDNFQNVNFEQFSFPSIIRHHVPVVSRDHGMLGVHYGVRFSRVPLGERNISSTNKVAALCPLNRFLVEGFSNMGPCRLINLKEYFHKTKPFSCTAHLGLFPPSFSLTPWIFPEIFHIHFPHSTHFLATNFHVPPMHIIIQNTLEISSFYNFTVQKAWMDSVASVTPAGNDLNLHILLSVKLSNLKRSHALTPSTGFIASAEILRICPACVHNDGKTRGTILLLKISSLEQRVLRSVAHGLLEDVLVLRVGGSDLKQSILAAALTFLRVTSWNRAHENIWADISTQSSLIEKVGMAHAYVWNSIMKNFSMPTRYEFNYLFQISLKEKKYGKSSYIFPHYIQDQLSTLRVMGCGKQGFTSISFEELVNVFDKIIWLNITISFVAVSMTMRILYKNKGLQKNLFSLLKCLLEQSDPFSTEQINVARLRCVIGVFLLMGIVLSNGYKNVNVYNMVVPRKPIPYKYFSELVRDNFSIYTRSFDICYGPERVCGREGVTEIPEFRFNKNMSLYIQPVVSEEFKFGERRSIFIQPEASHFMRGYNSKIRQFNETKLKRHSIVETTIVSLLQHKMQTEPERLYDLSQLVNSAFLKAQNLERNVLLSLLKNCQETAIVMPDQACRNYQQILISEQKAPDIFFGKESLSDVNWMFHLRGFVPPSLITRVHVISESGIWEWWLNLLTGGTHDYGNFVRVLAVNMKGNIVMVFIVWVAGICIASVCRLLQF